MIRHKGKRCRKKDWKSGFLHGACDTCETVPFGPGCPLPEACPKWEELLACPTHTEGEIWPQLWGDMADCERANAYNDGTQRSRIVEVLG